MHDRNASGINRPDDQHQPRVWVFTMDGFLPDTGPIDYDAPPTPADLAADRFLARLEHVRQQLDSRLQDAVRRITGDRRERTNA